jgi:tetratricopeptide (TPR) repeat protein
LEKLRERPRAALAALCAFGVVAVVAPVGRHARDVDMSRYYLAEDWGRSIFQSLEPGAIIVPSSDHSTFPLIYLQVVEGVRKDVAIADKYGTIDDQTLTELVRGKESLRVAPPLGAPSLEKQRYLVQHSGRPVYFTSKGQLHNLDTHDVVTHGLVFRAVKRGEEPKEAEHRALWAAMTFRPGSLERPAGNFATDLILADYHYAAARRELLFERETDALVALEKAERHGQGIREILNNLGGCLAEAGKPELAIGYFKKALEVDPDYDLATGNIANAHFALKRYRDGLPYFKRALELNPENTVSRMGLARAYREIGLRYSALGEYRRVYARDRWNQPLRSEIEELSRELFGKDSPLAKLEAPPRPREPEEDDWTSPPPLGPPDPALLPAPARGARGAGGPMAHLPHGPELPADLGQVGPHGVSSPGGR